ncbi:2-oxoglutarate dehydrogenase, E2 component, dihydrolipoamide succinyltransferase, partial [Actinomyces minihominis]|uniref:2-oxoglutarate dehydrogenase, E2 component, dihydrolipoamide succinyltransferase n=1 Tax=Actinomyces minihominis TaxID=2002838 RepID=UPI000C0899BA
VATEDLLRTLLADVSYTHLDVYKSPPPMPPAPPAPPAPPVTAPAPAAPAEALARAASTGTVVPPAPGAPAAAGYVTPIVRKLAKDKGIDLAAVTGTGIGGRIRKEDVIAAAEALTATPVASATPVAAAGSGRIEISEEAAALRGTTEKMSRLRQVIARRMVDSLQTAAQLTTVFEVDVTEIWNLRAKYKDQFEKVHGTRLTFLPFFVKAATEALAAHPKLNATINGNQVEYFDHENIGIAVDSPKGLMVPVLKNVGDMSIPQIAEGINQAAAAVRDGSIGPDMLSGSTFTITNTGSGGALFDTPVLNMPEVGIMGVGTIVKRPMVIKANGIESVALRSMVYLSISYDHRLVDGADASRFLTSVKKRLEAGNFLEDLQLG